MQEETAFLGYAIYHPNARAVAQIGDGALAVAFNIVRELAGSPPEAILMSRRQPRDIAPYRCFFGLLPRFDAEQHALTFPARLLSRPVQNANRTLRRPLEMSVAAYWAFEQPSIAEQVARYLRARIMFSEVTRAEVASHLSIHQRSLNRQLRAEGTSFRRLLGEARFEVARQLLAGTRIEITHMALILGYAEVSVFSHAFQRWSGVAPSVWRENSRIERPSAPPAVRRRDDDAWRRPP